MNLYNDLLDIYARIGELADRAAAGDINMDEVTNDLYHISDALYPLVRSIGSPEDEEGEP